MVNESEQTTLRQGLPETLGELTAALNNTYEAFLLGSAWAAWVRNGVERSMFDADTLLTEGWEPKIFDDHLPQSRDFYCQNLFQFLLRGLVRDAGQFVEHYMRHNDLIPKHKGRDNWSETPDPVYFLRLLRNGFNHQWTVGDVHRDVEWRGLVFKRNVGGAQPPEGYRKDDALLNRLPQDVGGSEVVGQLMYDVIQALEELSSDQRSA